MRNLVARMGTRIKRTSSAHISTAYLAWVACKGVGQAFAPRVGDVDHLPSAQPGQRPGAGRRHVCGQDALAQQGACGTDAGELVSIILRN